MLTLHRERHRGFTARHFHDKLRQHHGFALGYTWTKLRLQVASLVARVDGSRHRWLPALEAQLDLIVSMDDATPELY